MDGCSGSTTSKFCQRHRAEENARNGDICSVDGCEAGRICKGLCATHYGRFKKFGDPTVSLQRRSSRIIEDGDVCHVELSKGAWATIDREDRPLVETLTWHLNWRNKDNRYAVARRPYGLMHRLILGYPEGEVDHIDGDGLNNRKSNLRVATRQQNASNLRKSKERAGRPLTSDYRGVSLKDGRWRASIRSKGKGYDLGTFDSEEAAARAFDVAALLLHGEFARTNFPASNYSSSQIANALPPPRETSSKFKGVTRVKRGWQAQISINYKNVYLGTFPTEEEASAAFEAARSKRER